MKTKIKFKNPVIQASAILFVALVGAHAQPVITQQPVSAQTNMAGQTAIFSVIATGTPPLFYQWRKSSVAIPGETNVTLLLTNVQLPSPKVYSVVVSNAEGSVISTNALLYVLAPPVITRQPASLVAEVGNPVTFSVNATGTSPLSYQWLFNGEAIKGQTRPTLPWISVEWTNAGAYSVMITNNWGSVTSSVASLAVVFPIFTKITTGPLVAGIGSFAVSAWGDYNNDGFLDLFLSSFGGRNAFFKNNGDQTFSKITGILPVSDVAFHGSAACADYDNDGLLDLAVQAGGDANTPSPTSLYRNLGNLSFSRVPFESAKRIYNACGWADYDGDGFVDLYISTYGSKGFLYHNNGDGTLTKIPSSVVIEDDSNSGGCNWVDYDGDGFPDLFVTNVTPGGHPFLYHNNGDGTFARITNSIIVLDSGQTEAASWGDYNNDGFLDLYIGCYTDPFNRLYKNNGNGTFTRIVGDPTVTFLGPTHQGCAWGDYDNDGFLDLFTTSEDGANALFHNNGDGTFTSVTTRTATRDGFGATSHSCVWVDYDNDGALDLFVANQSEKNYLYHNNGTTNGWLKVNCIGTVSNRSAIGAKVRVEATIRGQVLRQLREIGSGNSVMAPTPLVAHFGLGDATNIDLVRIEWPSGTVQELHDISPSQFLTITEPPRLLSSATNGIPQFSLKGGRGFQYDIQASTNLAEWSPLTTVVVTNLNGIVQITDTNAFGAGRRFYRAASH